MTEPRNEMLESLRRLAKKSGLSLFGMPARDRFAILAACQQFCRPKPLPVSERPFTAYVQEWLDRTTGFLQTDAVELRRTLVDLGFVQRDTAGSAYALGPEAADPGASDLTGVIVATPAEERVERERRKAARV